MAHHYDTYHEELANAYPGFGYSWNRGSRTRENGTFYNIRISPLFQCSDALLPADHPTEDLLSNISTPPLNESDVVGIVETHDGTRSFIAPIKSLRFRLRMRVSKDIVVEFVASKRIWALRSAVVETSSVGRTQCQWLLSLELGELSPVVCVDADLFIEGSTLDATDSGGFDGPILAISFGSTMSELKPGRENAITVRLDDGPMTPMSPHLLNESPARVDAKGTFISTAITRKAHFGGFVPFIGEIQGKETQGREGLHVVAGRRPVEGDPDFFKNIRGLFRSFHYSGQFYPRLT
ncbi:hypothetical protein V8E53_015831 [Lactarius tabidus]